MPAVRYGLSAYYLIAPAEASSNLARYDGVRYGLRVPGADMTETYIATRTAGFGAEVKRRIMLGTYALSAGYYDAYYGKAQKVRTLIIRDFEEAYSSCDVLLSPTSPTTAFPLGAKTADPLTMYLSDVCTIPSNLAGHPAMSVPFGTGDDGLPVGVQVLAPALGETVMFQVAAVLEAAAPSAGGNSMANRPIRGRLGNGRGPRGPLRAANRDQALLRLPERLRRRAEHQHLPRLPRAARLVAGAQPARRRVRDDDRHGVCTARCSARSSTARTTSTRTCRRITR